MSYVIEYSNLEYYNPTTKTWSTIPLPEDLVNSGNKYATISTEWCMFLKDLSKNMEVKVDVKFYDDDFEITELTHTLYYENGIRVEPKAEMFNTINSYKYKPLNLWGS